LFTAEEPAMTTRTAKRRNYDSATSRIGVVDVGSNSVRLVVFGGETRSPAYFYNEKVLCGLGADLVETGRLSLEGRERAMAAIRRFVSLAKRMGLSTLDGVATAAVRDAADGMEFVEEVAAQTGLNLRVASGQDEARLAAQGVLLGWPDAEGLVADLGGASLELARIAGRRTQVGRTLPLGPLRLSRAGLTARGLDYLIDEALATSADLFAERPKRLFLVGGSWRALAKIHMARTNYPLDVLHEYELPAEEMLRAARWVASKLPEMLAETVSVSSARLAVTPLGAQVLTRLIRAAKPESVAISAFGLREGLYYEHISPKIRAEDPLLSACQSLERAQARFPGFGVELAQWLAPLIASVPPARQRLVEAACMLNDVSWNSHPDYREQSCFEAVYRANISGVGHRERAFIGAILLYRYKSSKKKPREAPALTILSPEDREEARTIGHAIRLGAMISGSVPGVLASCSLEISDEAVTLTLAPAVAELAGEVMLKRLAALASTMGREFRLEV
jgi:exopolyphosphatase/guanosine-5'-triphosphate,3'-diphosphate pyrophosphatase